MERKELVIFEHQLQEIGCVEFYWAVTSGHHKRQKLICQAQKGKEYFCFQ